MDTSEEIVKYWESEYKYRIKALPERSESNQELRKNPRFDIPVEKKVSIRYDIYECPVLNVSVGGIAFISEETLETGKKVELVIGNILYSEVEILSTTLDGLDSTKNKYKVRSKFSEGVNGFMLFVLLWDIANNRLNFDLVEELACSGASDDQIIQAAGVDETEYYERKANDPNLQAVLDRGRERQNEASQD